MTLHSNVMHNMPRPYKHAYTLAPIHNGAILTALSLWYLTSERPRLRGQFVVNGLALMFILRLVNRMMRRRVLESYGGEMPPEDDPWGHL